MYHLLPMGKAMPSGAPGRFGVALGAIIALVGVPAAAPAPASTAWRGAVRAGPPPLPPVLSTSELGPIQQNKKIQGRDGAQSGLFNGTSIWTFGDTILTVPGHDGDSWADNTESWTSDLNASDGIVLSKDYLDGTGAPTEFLPFTKDEARFNWVHDPDHCSQTPCGAEYALWGGPVVPDPAWNRVLFFYMKIYRVAGNAGWTTKGTGIAVWTPGSRVIRPIESPGTPDPTLMFHGDDVGFTSGSLVEGDTLYSYGCYPGFLVQYCQLAQVPLADALDRSQWSFYAGNDTWSPDPAAAVTVFEGGAANEVAFDPYLGEYLAIYSQPLVDDVMYRVSTTPWGPWSDSGLLFTGLSGQGFDYAAVSHPEYQEGDGQTLYVTYVRTTGFLQLEIRLVKVVFGQPG